MTYNVNFDIELKKNPYKGIYIALEGMDGSGKTTQAEKLAEYFKSQGREVVLTQEPERGGVVGKMVHDILQSKINVPKVSLQYLFSADRAIHQEEIVKPALEAGKVVISDRNFWSGVAYGMVDRDEAPDSEHANQLLVALSILSMYHQFIAPDYTLYLRVNTETAAGRLAKLDREAEIYERREFLDNVKKSYDWMAENFKDALLPINGEQDIQQVEEEILNTIKKPAR